MTNGYQQFFKKAREMAEQEGPTQFKSKGKPKRQFNLEASSAAVNQSLNQRKKNKSDATLKFEGNTRSETRQTMMNELHTRLKQKPVKAKKKIPARVLVTSFIGLLISAGGLYKADLVEKYIKHVEFSLMGYAGADEKSVVKEAKSNEKITEKTDEKKDKAVTGKDEKQEVASEVVKKEFSDEDISHFAKLNERKRELDAREEELNRLEQELTKQKAEMAQRLKDLEGTRRQISSVLEEKVHGDDKKVDSLVQMYSNMKPQQAAKVFETMDEDLAIEILGRMKKKPAAEILNLVKAEKAQVLSEKFAGYKRP